MPLPFESTSYDEILKQGWINFFHEEVRRLVEKDPITLAILTAIAFQNTTKGYAAEDHLLSLLEMEYGDFVIDRVETEGEG